MDSKISSSDNQANFAEAKADTLFTNYSQSPSDTGFLPLGTSIGSSAQGQTEAAVDGAVSAAVANANAQGVFSRDANFSNLFTESSGTSLGPNSQAKSSSETKVEATFSVTANQTFSFNFSAEIALAVKELGHSKTASNEAVSRSTFVVLDTTDPNNYRVLDYFGVSGDLSSPDEDHRKFKIGASDHVKVSSSPRPLIDRNQGTESLTSNVSGTYQRTFDHATNIALVEIDDSSIAVSGDSLTGTPAHQDDLTHGGTRGNFVVTPEDLKAGQSEIHNFDPSKDQVDIQGVGTTDTSSWLGAHHPMNTDKGALLEVTPGHSVLFQGVSADQINHNNVHTQ